MSVVSERCGDDGKSINNALQAANTAMRYIYDQKGRVVSTRDIQRINKIDDDIWEVDIKSPKFTGTVKISSGEAEIVED